MFNTRSNMMEECDPFSPVLPAISPIRLFEQFNAVSDLDPDELEPGDVDFMYIERPPIRIFFEKLFHYTLAQVRFANNDRRSKFMEYFNHTVNQSITLYLFWYTHVGIFESENLLYKFHDSGYINRLKKKFSDYFFFRINKEDKQWYFEKYHIVVSFAIVRCYRSHFRGGPHNKNSKKNKEREKMRNSPKYLHKKRINIFGNKFEMCIYQLISELFTGVRMKTSHIVKAINRTFYSRRRVFETNFYCAESRLIQEQRIEKIEQKKKSRSVVSELERKMKTLSVTFEHPLKRTTALRGGLTHQTIANLKKKRLKRRSTISNLNNPNLMKRNSSNTSVTSQASSTSSSSTTTTSPSSRPPSQNTRFRETNTKSKKSKKRKKKRKKGDDDDNTSNKMRRTDSKIKTCHRVRTLTRLDDLEVNREQELIQRRQRGKNKKMFDHLSKLNQKTGERREEEKAEVDEKEKNHNSLRRARSRRGFGNRTDTSGRLKNISTHFLLEAKKREKERRVRQQKKTHQRLVKVLTEEMSENEYFKYNVHIRESLRIMFMQNTMTTSGKQTRNPTLWCNYSLSPLINQSVPQPVNKNIIFFRNERKYIEPYYHSSSALPANKFDRQMKEHKKRWIETNSYDKFQESLVRQVAIQSVHEKIKKTYQKRIDWIVKEELEINEEFKDYNRMKQSCVNIFGRYSDLKNLKNHKVLNIDEIRTLSNRLSKRLTEYKRDMYDNIREERLRQKIRMKMNTKENRLQTQGFVNAANSHSFRS